MRLGGDMELEQALERIEELESTLAELMQNNLNEEDQIYVQKLKEDMKKAAFARDESKKKAESLAAELNKQKQRFSLEMCLKDKGCLDSRTFINAMEKEDFPSSEADKNEIDLWLEEKKKQYAYFFADNNIVSEETTVKPKTGPLVAARKVKTDMDTKQKAALAYKAS